MDRRSFGSGRPRFTYRPPHLSAAAQNPNTNDRSSNLGRRADSGDKDIETGIGTHRSGVVSGNSRQEKSNDGEISSNLVGTCTLMCPERERAQRERLGDLSVFERLNGDPKRSSPSLAV